MKWLCVAQVAQFGSDFYNSDHHYELTLHGKSARIWLQFLEYEGVKSEHYYECEDLYFNNRGDFLLITV